MIRDTPVKETELCRTEAGKSQTRYKEGVSYPEAQANARSFHGSYRTTGEEAPAGPRAGSRIETAGVASGPFCKVQTAAEYLAEARLKFPEIQQGFLRICWVDAQLKRDDAQLCYPYTPKEDGHDV